MSGFGFLLRAMKKCIFDVFSPVIDLLGLEEDRDPRPLHCHGLGGGVQA